MFRAVARPAVAMMLVLWLWPEVNAWPQTNAVDRAKEIQRALQRAEYQIASDLADSAIAHFEDFAPAQLVEIHALRALIAFERNELAAADAHFLSVLQLAPDYRLDPIFFSPAMQNRFEELRAKMPKSEPTVRIETRYVMLPDPRVKAAWKSLLLPGWGQRAKGQHKRATFFTVAAASLAAATVTAHVLRQRAEDDYLAATEATVADRYDTFNRYHQWRNSLALGLGVVWSAAVLDALIFPARPVAPTMGVAPTHDFSNPPILLSLELRF